MDSFSEPVRRWFDGSFPGPTRVQELGWPVLTRGGNALLVAPTGSGKTLAAFLWAIDRLSLGDEPAAPGVRVVYVSPLKALAYDIERNLQAPLEGVVGEARKPRRSGAAGQRRRAHRRHDDQRTAAAS